MAQSLEDIADAVFTALDPANTGPDRMAVYLCRCAVDFGQRAMEAAAIGNEPAFRDNAAAFRRFSRVMRELGHLPEAGE